MYLVFVSVLVICKSRLALASGMFVKSLNFYVRLTLFSFRYVRKCITFDHVSFNYMGVAISEKLHLGAYLNDASPEQFYLLFRTS